MKSPGTVLRPRTRRKARYVRYRRLATKRLSLGDALPLYADTPETPIHVASVTIFRPATQRDDLFARFREHVASRLDLLPLSRTAGAAWRAHFFDAGAAGKEVKK
jgi:hypothetical protein